MKNSLNFTSTKRKEVQKKAKEMANERKEQELNK